MKRALFFLLMMLSAICVLALAVCASTIYVDESGTELFECEIADGHHIDSYEIKNGGFAKFDSEGYALTWYLLSTESNGGNIIKTVRCVKTSEVYVNGAYTNGVSKNTVVSANYDEGTETVPVFGAYSGNYSKELLFIYIPDAVKTLPERFCQNVPVIVCEFSENSLCESWNRLVFWGAKSLRGLFIPKYFTKFPESSDGEFAGCTRMETLTFHKESTLEKWPSWYFGSTRIKEIRVPDSITYLNSRAFQGMGYLETVYLSPNLTHIYKNSNNHSLFHSCNSLKTVYIPKGLVAENLIDNYGGGFDYSFSSGAGVTFVYTGTLEEFLEIKSVICKASNNQQLSGATVENGRIVIADHCEVFYGGHSMSDDVQMQFTSYFEDVLFGSACKNKDCTYAGIDTSRTIGAMFVDCGYSVTEVPIGGIYSMSQFYGIDRNNIELYKAATNKSFEYGIVVSVSDDPLSEKNAELVSKGQTFITPEKYIVHDFFAVKVTGFKEETLGKALTFCAYVIDDGKIFYLDDGKTVEKVVMKSYSDIKVNGEDV